MEDIPTIGVAIANYNKAAFLPQCLDSVLEQTYPQIEVVVVDDASTDDSVRILEDFQQRHSNLSVIRLNENRGVAHARNVALDGLSSDWITTLDSDDCFARPDKLADEMAKLGSAPERHLAAFSDFVLVNERGKRIRPAGTRRPILEGDLFEHILTRSCLIPRDFLLHRSALDEVGNYDTSLPLYEDWDLKLRLARHLRFVFTGKVGVVYRQTGTGLSSADRLEHIKWMRTIFERYVQLSKDPDAVRAQFDKRISPNIALRAVRKLAYLVRR